MDSQLAGAADDELVYLKAGVIVEPLMNGWHAWPHLIPSLQQGLNATFRQLPMMHAFAANPAFHEAASRNPDLAGGAFLDCRASQVTLVQNFIKHTQQSSGAILALAKAFTELDRQVQDVGTGGTLASLYDGTPASIKGCVELVYDRNGHPGVRVLEPLIYSLGLNRGLQQLHLSVQDEDARKFFLTGPVIDPADGVTITAPFAGPLADALARANLHGVSAGLLRELTKPFLDWERLSSFLTTSRPPKNPRPHKAGGLRITHFGHACILIETTSGAVLIDPVLAWNATADDCRHTYADLPQQLDIVAISHGHHDHFSPESLLQLRHKTDLVVVPRSNAGSVLDPSLGLMLNELGFSHVKALECLETIAFPGGKVMSLPFFGEHAELDISSKQGFLVEVDDARIAFLVDSNVLDPEAYSKALKGEEVDILFIGMECHGAPMSWLYGPLLGKAVARKDDESRRLSASDAEKAWALVEAIKPKQVFVYAMGLEPWVARYAGFHFEEDSVQLREARKFVSRCQLEGISATILRGSGPVDITPEGGRSKAPSAARESLVQI